MLLLTEDFVAVARMLAKSYRISPNYVVFPRTFNTMSPEEVQAETEKACGKVVSLLSQPA